MGLELGVVKLSSVAVRILQFIFGIVVLAIYANQRSWQNGQNLDQQSRWSDLLGSRVNLGIAAGAIAMISSAIYIGITFFLDFVYVAWAFVWDMIVMIIHAALFAEVRKALAFGDKDTQDFIKRFVDAGRFDLMSNTTWVVLVAMLLWVITFLMGITVLIFSRLRGSKVVN